MVASYSKVAQIMILTIGHSTQSYEAFRDLVLSYDVTAIADVRSSPFSRHTPQFNQAELKNRLSEDGIAYVFLGDTLGGRPTKSTLLTNGVADYGRMAAEAEFAAGLERVISGSQKFRIAMMCAERDPLDCHRCLLVGRALHQKQFEVSHILGDGNKIGHLNIEAKLISLAKQNPSQTDMFASEIELLNTAYQLHSRRVAYAEPTDIEPAFEMGAN
jgi:uncharacterized protein (DUF488 family)